MPIPTASFSQQPMAVAPGPSEAPVGQQKKGAQESVAPIPFARASKWHIEQSNVQSGVVLSGAGAQVFNFPLASYGYLSAVILTCTLSGGTSTGMTYFEDAPYSLIQQIQLSDVNGVPIYQLSGFNAYLAAKYGGYRLFAPDGGVIRGAPFDTGSAGTAITAVQQTPLEGGPQSALGTFIVANTPNYGAYNIFPTNTILNCRFIIPIFLEFGLDGLGCLPNMDASARYNLQVTVAGGALVAANQGPVVTAITANVLPTLTMNVEILARSQPPSQDMFGNPNSVAPPAVGTVQYWTAQTASGLSTGANTIQLTRVGNLIRNHILVFRVVPSGALGPRGQAEVADMPSLFEMDWDVGQRYVALTSTLRFLNAYSVMGLGDPNGCIWLPDTLDPDKLAISEYGDEWLGSVGATKFTLRFTPGGTGTGGSVTILTNDIVPASGQVYQAPQLLL